MPRLSQIKKKIVETKLVGETLPEGKLYAQLPKDFLDVPYYRDTEKRWEFIKKYLRPDMKSFMDLGCSTGHYCFKLAEQGCVNVVGVDNDKNDISVASDINDYYGYDIEFLFGDVIDLEFDVDLTLFLSTFQWSCKQHGLSKCKDFLAHLADMTKFLFFETSGSDSMASLPEADSEEWISNLLESSGFTVIRKELLPAETGSNRWIYYCKSVKR